MQNSTDHKFVVYVLRDIEGKLYKGFTSNLEKRIYYHNNGFGNWTKGRGPFDLVYKENFENKSDALKREKFLKSGKGREFLKSVIIY